MVSILYELAGATDALPKNESLPTDFTSELESRTLASLSSSHEVWNHVEESGRFLVDLAQQIPDMVGFLSLFFFLWLFKERIFDIIVPFLYIVTFVMIFSFLKSFTLFLSVCLVCSLSMCSVIAKVACQRTSRIAFFPHNLFRVCDGFVPNLPPFMCISSSSLLRGIFLCFICMMSDRFLDPILFRVHFVDIFPF